MSSSALTSKPYQLSRLLLISPNMCSNWKASSNRTRSSSAPPGRALKHCAAPTATLSIDSSAAQDKKPFLSIGFCDNISNKTLTLATPSKLPLTDASSSEQYFAAPFQKVILLKKYLTFLFDCLILHFATWPFLYSEEL